MITIPLLRRILREVWNKESVKAENRNEMHLSKKCVPRAIQMNKSGNCLNNPPFCELFSEDEQKRLEYTARQKALYDYNTIVEENFERGLEQKERELIEKWRAKGMTDEQIRELLE